MELRNGVFAISIPVTGLAGMYAEQGHALEAICLGLAGVYLVLISYARWD